MSADPHRPITLTYDLLDRLLTDTTSLGTVSYTYDSAGRRSSMTVSGQNPVIYTYDANSQLCTLTQAPLNPVTLDYDAANRRTLLTLPNGVSTQYVYDLGSRLTALVYRNALGQVGDLQYTYDAGGNRIAMGGSFARTLLPEAVPSATYDAANRQLAFGAQAMTFDDNGNLLTQTDASGTTTYTWDARNRLTGLSGPAVAASFAYDAVGRRAVKTISGNDTGFQYDGLDIAQESGGTGPVSYIRSLSIDEALVRTDSTGSAYYLADALGSSIALADGTGATPTSYTYAQFGGTTVSGASANPFQFTGRENDGTGLYYYRARYYDPVRSRFLREDPLGFAGGSNYFAYVGNNPTRFTDPAGLLASTLLLRGASILFRTGATAEEIAVQARLFDSIVGGVSAIAGRELPASIRSLEVPGVSGLTVGTAAEVISGYGGVRTITFAGTVANASGIAGASVATVSGSALVLGGLSALGGYQLGRAIDTLILDKWPGGNPVERAFCATLYECTLPQSDVGVSDKGRFGRGR